MKYLLPVVAMVAIPAEPARACSCIGPGTPCQSAGQSDAVFTGRVTGITERGPKGKSWPRRVVNIEVTEALSGVSVGQMVTVLTGFGGGDCGFAFRPGGSYVVYAYLNREKELETGICTRTAEVSRATEDLEYLRHNVNAGEVGEIRVRTGFGDKPGPAGQHISLVRDGARYAAVTGADGAAVFSALPGGEYVVHADADGDLGDDPLVRLGAKGCQEVQLLRSLVVSGLVTSESGEPAKGVSIEARSTDGKTVWDVATGRDGRYELRVNRPGEYRVGVNLSSSATRHSPYPRWFYPGTTEAAAAAVLHFAGQHEYRTLDLRLPSVQEPRVIEGVVLQPAGQPAPHTQMILKDTEGNIVSMTPTDEAGRFRLEGFAGNAYRVHAGSAPPADIAAGFQPVALRLTLPAANGAPSPVR